MNVLVTGGAGYIGSHAVRLLREQRYGVVVLDTMEYGQRQSISDAKLVQGDTADIQLVERVLRDEGIDAVMHFAAYKSVGESMERPERYFENNVCGTLGLLKAMQWASVKRLVFSSSCAVNGTPDELPVSETSPVHPESVYGETKLMVETMLRWMQQTQGLRSASLRYFNAAGAAPDGSIGEDWTRTLNLIPLVMKAALGQAPAIKVFGTNYPTPDGTAIRDYVHVLDLVDAHIKALDYLAAHAVADVFNLGTGVGSSVKQVIDTTKQVSGVEIPIEYVARRPGDAVATYADNRKARELLGWQPQYDLHAIIESAWKWHSSHPHGYQ